MTLHLDHNANPPGHRILLVEDNVLNQKLVVFMLQSRDFETDVCSNGKEAVEKLKNEKFDLVLMDIEMPEMNGYEATEKIRHELRLDIPIIALTAHASEGEREKCLSHGMSDYLAKPFKGEEFYHIIRSHLAGEIEHTDIHG